MHYKLFFRSSITINLHLSPNSASSIVLFPTPCLPSTETATIWFL